MITDVSVKQHSIYIHQFEKNIENKILIFYIYCGDDLL